MIQLHCNINKLRGERILIQCSELLNTEQGNLPPHSSDESAELSVVHFVLRIPREAEQQPISVLCVGHVG